MEFKLYRLYQEMKLLYTDQKDRSGTTTGYCYSSTKSCKKQGPDSTCSLGTAPTFCKAQIQTLRKHWCSALKLKSGFHCHVVARAYWHHVASRFIGAAL